MRSPIGLIPLARFLAKVSISDRTFRGTPCVEWTGDRTSGGYGRFAIDGRYVHAHCWLFEKYLDKTIPERNEDGHLLHVDHLCRNRLCVNVFHLEVVTHAENVKRGIAPTIVAYKSNVCVKGLHELTEENVKVSKNGRRRCRACANAAARALLARTPKRPSTPEQRAKAAAKAKRYRERRKMSAG